jgi:Ran GTPase-activating protein (RanGAP) involved in mRNA processing and transport
VRRSDKMPENKDYQISYDIEENGGISVWNTLESQDGKFKELAFIDRSRNITFLDENLPENVKSDVKAIAEFTDFEELEAEAKEWADYYNEGKPEITELDLSLPDPAMEFQR